jgi:hypothetical protein
MKTCVMLMTLMAAGSLAAQPIDQSMRTELGTSGHESLIVAKPAKPNEIAGHKVVYSGVAVQIVKTKQPLELINIFAPVENGTQDGNMQRDVITGKPTGFKFFSISF